MSLAVDAQPAGLVGVADPIKATTQEALGVLRQSGLHIVMVTGDSRATAEAVARKLGIDDVVVRALISKAPIGSFRRRRSGLACRRQRACLASPGDTPIGPARP
jgi:Cu+-exporting ATPase